MDCAAEIPFDKADICDRIVKHGGCILDHFDLAAVRLLLLCYTE